MKMRRGVRKADSANVGAPLGNALTGLHGACISCVPQEAKIIQTLVETFHRLHITLLESQVSNQLLISVHTPVT